MSQPLTLGDPRVQRLEQAALWLQRLHEAGQDGRVIEAWLDWYQRDPQNQQAFDELAAVWELGGGLGNQTSGADGLLVTGAAASAATDATISGTSAADGQLAKRRMALAASLAGLGLAVVAGGGWWLSRPAPEHVLTSEYSSPTGTNSSQTLHDGSLLELGGGTRVTVSIGEHARRVELHEGELFVAVRRDTGRPFSVEAGRLKAIATGTAYNVQRTGERTIVTVAEGSVDARYEGADAGAPNVQLQPGQQLIYHHASHRVTVRQTDPLTATSWRTGTLYFEGEPLSEVIATVNRYAATPIIIEDARVRALSVTGTAHIQRIDSWLQALPYIHPVSIETMADGRQKIAPRPTTGSD